MHTTFCLNTSYSYVGPLKDLRTDRSQTYANKQHNDDQTLFQLVYTVFYMVLLRITFTSRVLDISSWLLRKTRKIRWNVNLSCTDRAVFDRSNGSEITRKKSLSLEYINENPLHDCYKIQKINTYKLPFEMYGNMNKYQLFLVFT